MDHYQALRNLLLSTLPAEAQNLYFQPPDGKDMKYPCIVYEVDDIDIKYANNKPYLQKKKYKVQVIDRDPLSPTMENVSQLQLASFQVHFTSANLHHYVFSLYY